MCLGSREDVDHNAFDLDPWRGRGIIKVEKVSPGLETRGKVSPELAINPTKLQNQGLIHGSEVTPSGVCSFLLLS